MTNDRTTDRQLAIITDIIAAPDFPSQEALTAAGIEHVLPHAGKQAVHSAIAAIRDRMADEGIDINIYDDTYDERFRELEQATYEAALTEARSHIKALAADIAADYAWAASHDLTDIHKDTAATIIRRLRSPLVRLTRGDQVHAQLIPGVLAEMNSYKAAEAQ